MFHEEIWFIFWGREKIKVITSPTDSFCYLKIRLSNLCEIKMQMDWWNVASIVVAVATLLATIIIGYYTLVVNKKKIDFYVISKSPLVNIDDKYKNDLQIFYKGKEIKEAIALVLRICNSGNQAIRAKDFNRPISFEFKQETKIFNAKIIDVNPTNLRINFSIEDNIITLEKTLLNPKDSIKISLIASSSEQPVIDARILGVSKIFLQEDIDEIIWTKKKLIEYYTGIFIIITIGIVARLIYLNIVA